MNQDLLNSLDTPVAFVVDDDDVDRESIAKSLERHGIRVRAHATADSFLRVVSPEQTGCLVLDIHMPGMSGQELQEQLIDRFINLPIIFVSGSVNVSIATSAMRRGATDVLEKPVETERLLAAVKQSFNMAVANKQTYRLKREVHLAMESLTPRERMIMQWLVDGFTMKEMAASLQCSIATIARYQSKVLEKMGATNTSDLAIKLHRAAIIR